MVDRDLIEAFNDCIDRLAQGSSIGECLRAYPQYADQLRPMLTAGGLVRRAQLTTQEVATAQDRVRFRVEQALNTAQPPSTRRRYPRRILAMVASILLIFGVFITGASIIAQDSLPDDPLYSLKRFTEDIRLIFTPDRDGLEREFARRRVDETHDLLTEGRNADVTFSGDITAQEGHIIMVDDLQVNLQDADVDLVQLRVGARVEIDATTDSGRLLIRAIRLIDADDNVIPIPAPTQTATPTTTHTPDITSTATLTPTSSPTLTYTPTPTSTLTPTPTPSATSTPRLTPTRRATRTPQSTPTERDCVVNPPQHWVIYEVQVGDTLFELALARDLTVQQVRRANCLIISDIIYVGQLIYLPPLQQVDTPPSGTGITRQEAQTIALSLYDGVTVTSTEFITRNDQPVWVVGLSNSATVYIHAETGAVLLVDEGNNNNGGDDGGGGDDGRGGDNAGDGDDDGDRRNNNGD